MLRTETKTRARALQLLYAWDIHGRQSLDAAVDALRSVASRRDAVLGPAHGLARAVVDSQPGLDAEIASAAENWRLERIGVIECNILRIGVHELRETDVPAAVIIDEAVRLAHWFAGPKAPAFVNGLLDTIARRLGRL